jgi:hypothetical protein
LFRIYFVYTFGDMKKLFDIDADNVKFLEKEKKNFGSEKNIVNDAVRKFASAYYQERHEKMLKQFNLNNDDTNR